MSNKNLLITVGHNASAVYYNETTKEIIGYEQERFDKIKSSSNWPIDAINEIKKHIDISGCKISISDWFTNRDIDNKYVDQKSLNDLIQNYNCTVEDHIDHHKLHAQSAVNFNYEHNGEANGFSLVIDGFGNFGKSFSVFSYDGLNIESEIWSSYTYKFSLGLLYQYSIGFLGMKENQDEYKLLGYESHISIEDKQVLDPLISKYVKIYVDGLCNSTIPIVSESLIPFELLDEARKDVYQMLNDVTSVFKEDSDTKIIVAYFVQSLLEQTVMKMVKFIGLENKNVCCAGGVFYNVKLNNVLANALKTICVMPVCGDQGAALGAVKGLEIGSLRFGKRKVEEKKRSQYSMSQIVESITNGGIVNIVQGDMEFGPRALCNTSSIFLPRKKIVDHVNKINGRDTYMPCAPVMLRKNVDFFFKKEDVKKVVGSNKFMIITHDYNQSVSHDEYDGVMHQYPLEDRYSGRPQVIDDESSLIYKILEKCNEIGVKCLVNTSFNVHGQPIVFTHGDVKLNYNYQVREDSEIENILLYENSF